MFAKYKHFSLNATNCFIFYKKSTICFNKGMSKKSHIQLIINSLNQEKRFKTLSAFCLIFIGSGTLFHCFDDNLLLAMVGFAILVSGIYYAYHLATTPIVLPQLITQRSREIVWIYSMVIQRMPFGVQFSKQTYVYFKLLDGEEIVISIPEKNLEELMKTLNAYLPHATFGYSDDKELWYSADPAMMYQEER